MLTGGLPQKAPATRTGGTPEGANPRRQLLTPRGGSQRGLFPPREAPPCLVPLCPSPPQPGRQE